MKTEITLSKVEREEFIRQARREFVAEMITAYVADFDLVSRSQAGGILDVAPNTLSSIKELKPIELIPGKVVKYRLSDIKALLVKKGDPKK